MKTQGRGRSSKNPASSRPELPCIRTRICRFQVNYRRLARIKEVQRLGDYEKARFGADIKSRKANSHLSSKILGSPERAETSIGHTLAAALL